MKKFLFSILTKNQKTYIYACIYTYKMTKVISLSDNAYAELAALKKPGDSFSDVVGRIAKSEKKRNILDFFGKWPGSKSELNKISSELKKERENFRLR